MSEAWRRPDDFMRDQPQRTRIVYERTVSAPLLRALAGAIGRRVDALAQQHRPAIVRGGVEAFVDELADVLADASAAPLTFMHDEQRRAAEGPDGGE